MLKDELDRERQLILTEAVHALILVDGSSAVAGHALCTILAYLCPSQEAVESIKENIQYYYDRIKEVKAEDKGLFGKSFEKVKS